jgi:hypothetical protein
MLNAAAIAHNVRKRVRGMARGLRRSGAIWAYRSRSLGDGLPKRPCHGGCAGLTAAVSVILVGEKLFFRNG